MYALCTHFNTDILKLNKQPQFEIYKEGRIIPNEVFIWWLIIVYLIVELIKKEDSK